MGNKIKIDKGEYLKKDTVYVIATAALIIGFISGIIYEEYIRIPAPELHKHDHEQADNISGAKPDPGMTDEISKLQKEAEANPKNAELWTKLGNMYFDTNQVKKSIEAYNKSLKLKPDNANVLTDLGVMYRKDNQAVKAVEAFNKAIKIDPKHEISRLNKGIVLLYDLGDKKGALEAWQGLLKINPSAVGPSGLSVAEMVENLKKEK